MSALSFGSLTLDPTFSSATLSYTTTTTNASNTITATPADESASVAIMVGETPVESGNAATWQSGENTVKITVTNGESSTEYTVTVTKSE